MATAGADGKQLLHLVFGGRLKALDSDQFENLDDIDIVGIYPNYRTAYDAWKQCAQRSVDDAMMRYYVVHLHRLFDPVAPPKTDGD